MTVSQVSILGMTPLEAIRTATMNPADSMDEIGNYDNKRAKFYFEK